MNTPQNIVWVVAVLLVGWCTSAHADRGAGDEVGRTHHDEPRFSITVSGDDTILLDKTSGQTWLLTRSDDSDASVVWMPLKRVDGEAKTRGAVGRVSAEEPRVVELQKRVERLEQLVENRRDVTRSPSQYSLTQQLFPLLLKKQELLLTHGENHPDVVALDKKIKMTRSLLTQEPAP